MISLLTKAVMTGGLLMHLLFSEWLGFFPKH